MKTFAIVTILTLAVAEIFCRIGFEKSLRSLTPSPGAQTFEFITDSRPQSPSVDMGQTSHPYFGHTWKRQRTDSEFYVENFESKDVFTNEFQERYFDIGVFGGSVAWAFARHMGTDPSFYKVIQEQIHTSKPVRILNFSIPVGRQPRQLAIAIQYGHFLDLAISLEGVNEIAFLHSDNRPPYFPENLVSSQLFPVTKTEKVAAQFSQMIANLGDFIQQLSLSLPSSLIRSIAIITPRLELSLLMFINSLRDTVPDSSFSQQSAARQWLEILGIQKYIFEKDRVPYFLFLQPVPNFPGAKALTEKERQLLEETHRTNPGLLIQEGVLTDLHSQLSIPNSFGATSLLTVFEGEHDDIFVDGFCHVNTNGNRILLKAILATINAEKTAR